MDPKKSLEGFRVEALQTKKEVRIVPKQTYKKGNAILIILCASLIGLTTGIGSAFAFGIKEMPPNSSPLDEPTAESPVDQMEPSIKQSEIKTSELTPQKPPIDEPTVEESPVDKRVKEEKKAKDSTPPVTKHEKVETKNSEPNKSEKKNDKLETTKDNNAIEEHKSKSASEQKASSNQNTAMNSSDSAHTSKSTLPSEGKTTPSENTNKETILNNSVTGPTSSGDNIHTQTDQKSVHTDQVAVSSDETPDPKTKIGTLPETAGNDLNHAVASFVIVCFSIAYLLARKETHPEK